MGVVRCRMGLGKGGGGGWGDGANPDLDLNAWRGFVSLKGGEEGMSSSVRRKWPFPCMFTLMVNNPGAEGV